MTSLIDAQILRSMREARGWDQRTLSQVAGVNPSVVSRLERGLQTDLRASVLVAIARALETSVDSLLDNSEQPSHSAPIGELQVVMEQAGRLPEGLQRQVVAIIRAYLVSLPE